MKKLKRIFSMILVLTIATLGVVVSTPEVSAYAGSNFTFTSDKGEVEIKDTPGGMDFMKGSNQLHVVGGGVGANYTQFLNTTVLSKWGTLSNQGIATFTFKTTSSYDVVFSNFTGSAKEEIYRTTVYDHELVFELKITAPKIRLTVNNLTFDSSSNSNNSEGGAGITVHLEANVIEDNKRPAISGQENFVTNVDDAKTLSFFQAYISAVDETDGVVPVYVITDNYTANMSVLGTHKVVFGAKDNSDNEATLEVYIRVVDITNPIISGNSSVAKIGYKETWSISNFKTTLTVSDNYDTLTHNDVTVKNDGYTSNKTKLGTYNVVYAVLDNSGNEGTFTKQVQVYDNVKPNISGPSTIATSNATLLTEADIRAQLTASDEIDGNITDKIELVDDNYTGNGNKVGTYTITYRVVDNAGNVGEHTVTIQRSDKIPPVFFIEDGVTIKTTPTTPLNFNQIIQILEATGQVTVNSATTFSTIWEDYTGNEEEPGIYTWAVKARSTDGNASDHYMSIMVLDTEDDDGVEVNPDLSALEWIKENPVLFAVSLFAVIAVVGIIFRKKRK